MASRVAAVLFVVVAVVLAILLYLYAIYQESTHSERLLLKTLTARQAESKRPMKVIDFLLAGHISPPISLTDLLACGVLRGRPPQSIARIDEARYRRLRPQIKLGFAL